MSLFSFRRFFENRSPRSKRAGRKQRKPARRILSLEALEHRLAPATLQDVLPAAIVNGQTALTTAGTNIGPQVAVDPISPNKIFEVHSTGGGLAGFYSTDSNASQIEFGITPLNDSGLPLDTIDPVSVAIDRSEEVYIVWSHHSADNTSGQIEFTRFNFSGGVAFQDLGVGPLYTWMNSDPAYNPTVIVDNNVPSFTDLTTNAQTTDTMVGKAIFVVWNTDWTNTDGTHDHAINVTASEDAGQTFSNVVEVGGGNHPVGFFTQGTAAVAGGLLNIISSTDTDPNTNTTSATLFQTRPDGGVASRRAVSNVVFTGAGGNINESIANFDSSGNRVEPDTPVPTKFDITLTASQFPTDFTTLENLSVSMGIFAPDMREMSITLTQKSTGDTIHLLLNSIDDSGNTVTTQGIQSSSAVPNLGATDQTHFPGTVFDSNVAHRSITDPQNVAPFIGTFRPEQNDLRIFNGMTAAQLAGTWELTITDHFNEGGSNTTLPTQFLNNWSLHFTSQLNLSGSNTNLGIGALPGSISNTYPTALTAAGAPGVGPNLAVAVDNTLGSFSPFQGTMYVAYTGSGVNAGVGNGDTDVFLVKSTDLGASWSGPVRINNDQASDNFSEGNRAQFMPQLAVDPVTGTLVAMWYDARFDASNARVATFLSTSIDGGNTFSPFSTEGGTSSPQSPDLGLSQVYLNASNTAIDAITQQTRVIEPIPSNGPNATGLGFGEHQGLAVYGGQVFPFWAGNNNDVNTAIYTANVTIAAGPRILQGDQGPIGKGGSIDPAIVSFTADGTPELIGFRVTFDRPVDPGTFTTDQVQLHYHKPSDPTTTFTDLSGQVLAVQALDPGPFGATQFLVQITPQSLVGDYSYAIGPNIMDRIRTTSQSGTAMDQDNNAIAGEVNNSFTGAASGDLFSVPGPIDRSTPIFQVGYDPQTLPLIIPGPHVVATSVPGLAPSSDNLTFNGTANAIDVVFDRDINPATFTNAAILRLVTPVQDGEPASGPRGVITSGFTVTANPSGTPAALAKRTFRIGFPTQNLSGTYSIVFAPTTPFSPTITDVNGIQMDTNLNAGVDTLRGFSTSPSVGAPITFTNLTAAAVSANATTTSSITITDQFIIQQDGVNHIQVRLNITSPSGSPINDPDLTAKLIAPNGKVITLFTNVGNVGAPPHANFLNSTFDDFATSPIQLAPPPFDIGPFNPQLPLSQLKGLSATGTWKLKITNKGSTTGTLTDWALILPPPVLGTGLGEPIADQANVSFRIFTEDPTNSLSHSQWTAVGGAANNSSRNSGRIGGIAVDPSDPSGNTVYVAGASGGVWKTNNFYSPNGPTWVPLTDLGPPNSLNIGSITVFGRNNDPNQSIVFVSTGEGDAIVTNNAPFTGPGVGLLRSMDGGKTWSVLDSTDNTLPMASRDHLFVGLTSFKVIVDPKALPDGNVAVYVAFTSNNGNTNGGVYRSIDSGNHWTLIRAGNATDVVLAAGSAGTGGGNLSVLYAAFQGDGVYRTTSALTAVSMTQLLGGDGFPTRRNIDTVPDSAITITNPTDTPNGAKGRIDLATPTLTNNRLADTNYQGWLYALVIGADGNIDDLYLTKDFGHNWTRLVIPFFSDFRGTFPTNDESKSSPYNPFGGPLAATTHSQGNYDVSFAIDPINPNVVYIGGANDLTPKPAGGLIRVDVTTLDDPYALIQHDNSDHDGGLVQSATTGSFDPDGAPNYGILTSLNQNYFNIAFDPINPFLTQSSLPFTGVSNFRNAGDDLRWGPVDVDPRFLLGSTDQHRLLAVVDPLTGKTRLIAGDDQGIFSAVTNSDGSLDDGIGFANAVTGSRNGNLQITQFYYGAVQPSSLAAEIQGALFYGMAQDDGFPVSQVPTGDIKSSVLENGNLNWVGPTGDGTGVATDQTGSGQVYEYRFPCCNAGVGPLASDFFIVQLPGHHGEDFISRVTGLLLPGDDPATDTGEWPLVAGSNFAVNPIDPTAIVMSSQAGRIFRTSGPLTGTGVQWFEIAGPETIALDGTYAPAEAFGAPNPNVPGVVDDYILVGTSAGNVWVTTTGGTSWSEFGTAQGLDGSAVQAIVTDPTHGTDDAYVVTLNGVYFIPHATSQYGAASTSVTNITGNLFSLTNQLFNDPSQTGQTLLHLDLHALAVDWRFKTSTTNEVLYVGGKGGVYRSDDKGTTWRYFPDITHEGAVQNGGLLPNTIVTDLDLALGDINPTTGLPSQSTGFNMLVATTFGRGTFAIRLDQNLSKTNDAISGPAVSTLDHPIANTSDSSTEAITVTFGRRDSNGNFVATPVDPATFTPAGVVLKDPNGNIIPVRKIIELAPTSTGQHNVYKLIFAGTVAGNYTVTIGPKISDFNGDLMDQDNDGVNGATLDKFTGSISITPAARPTVGLPFADSFGGSFGDSLGRQWVETNGRFQIQSNPDSPYNVAVALNSGTNTAVLQLATAQAAVTVQADVNVTSTTGATVGVLARYVDANNYFWGTIQNVRGGFFATIFRNFGGNLQSIGSTAISSGAGTLRLEVVDDSLKLFLNDKLVTFSYDNLLPNAGKIGIQGTQGTTFGNFSADVITLLTPNLPFFDDFSVAGPGAQLDRNWIDQFGNIGVAGGVAIGEAPYDLSVVNGVNQADVVVTTDVNLTSTGQATGLVTRYGGPLYSNFYLGQIVDTGSGFKTEIFKNIGGAFTQLAVGTVVGTGTGTLEFEAVGPSLKLIWNGTLVAFADDLSLATGSVGMRLSQTATADNFNAAAVVQLTPMLPFSDDFSTTSDGSQLDRNWTDQFGNISVVSGAATGTAGYNLSTVNGINQADVSVTTDVNLTSTGQATGLVTRYVGSLYSNFYLGQIVDTGSGFKTEIFKNIGGTFTQLAVGTTVNTGTGTLEFEAVGPSLKLIFNGALVAFADDLSLASGSVGMRLSQTATAANFNAAAVVQLTPMLPFSDNFSTTSDGSQLNRNWTDQFGNITVVSGVATGEAAYNLSTVNGVNQADVSVATDVNLTSTGQAAGLVTRYVGSLYNNFYLGQIVDTGSGFKTEIFKNIGGTFTQLAVGTTVNTGTGTLEFEAVGQSLKLIFNGALVAFAFDGSLGSGSVGMRLSQTATAANFNAAAVVQLTPPAPLAFSDDFSTTSDGSQLNRNWSDQFGNITVVSGLATGTAAYNLSTVNGVNQADVTVTGDVNLTSTAQAAGLVTRYGGPLYNNFYLGQMVDTGSGFKTEIFKNIGGAFTQLAVGTTVSTGTGTLEFEAVGQSLKLIFNGALVAFAFDGSLASGSVGMRLSQTATAANFNAAAVVQLTPMLPFSDDFSTTSDGSQLNRNWSDQFGNITVVSGAATGEAAYNLSTVNGVNQADVTVSGDVNLTSTGQAAGLVARYGGPLYNNFYLGQIVDTGTGFKTEIFKNIGGVFTQLAVGTVENTGTGTLTLQVTGSSTLVLSWDGTVVATVVDTSLATGSVGMRLSLGTTLNNFKISSP